MEPTSEGLDRLVAQAESHITKADEIFGLEVRLAKLEAWARAYANPILFRALDFGEKKEINKATPYDPPAGRDIPDLTKREV